MVVLRYLKIGCYNLNRMTFFFFRRWRLCFVFVSFSVALLFLLANPLLSRLANGPGCQVIKQRFKRALFQSTYKL